MTERYLAAAGIILLWLLLCLHARNLHRRRARREQLASDTANAHAGSSATVIAYASQTGNAEDIAARTAHSLQAAGLAARLVPLSLVDEALLARNEPMLFIVSTTGEGDAPDSAAGFTSRLMQEAGETQHQSPVPASFSALRYAVLALGDQEYTHFCRFGRILDNWLQGRGAQSLFERIEVDNGDPEALQHWQRQVADALRAPALQAWQAPGHETWLLAERHLLNPGNPQSPCYHLVLRPCDNDLPPWQAGDIAEICIPGSPRAPAQASRREYSIASLPADQAIHLLVRQMRSPDGELGLGSGWLTAHLRPGDTLPLRIRTNRSFHAPDPARGLILIGNGTGLAGLRAHLKARISAGLHQNWLLFGERSRRHDYYFEQELETWRREGALQRLDLAFSRDRHERIYVQHLIRQASDTLRAWMEQGAAIYVCGSLEGMARDVHATLTDILGAAQMQRLIDTGRYRRDVY